MSPAGTTALCTDIISCGVVIVNQLFIRLVLDEFEEASADPADHGQAGPELVGGDTMRTDVVG